MIHRSCDVSMDDTVQGLLCLPRPFLHRHDLISSPRQACIFHVNLFMRRQEFGELSAQDTIANMHQNRDLSPACLLKCFYHYEVKKSQALMVQPPCFSGGAVTCVLNS